MRTRLLRYFTTYRWELWLIIGIPAVSVVVHLLSAPLIDILLSDRLGSLSIDNASQVAYQCMGACPRNRCPNPSVSLLSPRPSFRTGTPRLALGVLHRDSGHRRCYNNSRDCRRSLQTLKHLGALVVYVHLVSNCSLCCRSTLRSSGSPDNYPGPASRMPSSWSPSPLYIWLFPYRGL